MGATLSEVAPLSVQIFACHQLMIEIVNSKVVVVIFEIRG